MRFSPLACLLLLFSVIQSLVYSQDLPRLPTLPNPLFPQAPTIVVPNPRFAGTEPLREALGKKDAKAVADILDSNPDLANQRLFNGGLPLFVAVEQGDAGIVKVLLDHKADISQVGFGAIPRGTAEPVLHLAARSSNAEVVGLLLDAGTDPNQCSQWGANPLQIALQSRNEAVVKLLLAHGADIFLSCTPSANTVPINIAMQTYRGPVLDLLLTNVTALNRTDTNGNTLLHYAAKFGRLDALQILLDKGMNVNAQNTVGLTPLDEVSRSTTLFLFPANQFNPPKITRETLIDLLLSKGAAWDIFAASAAGKIEVVQSLLGVDETLAKALDGRKQSPLHWAAYAEDGKIVDLLIGKGCPLESLDASRRNPLHQAAEQGHEMIVRRLISHQPLLSPKDNDGNTPLHLAAHSRKAEAAKALIEAGADINSTNNLGNTPLDIALAENIAPIANLLLKVRTGIDRGSSSVSSKLHAAVRGRNPNLVELVLQQGADINARDSEGKTALGLAIELNAFEVVRLLLEKGADVNAGDSNGKTPLQILVSSPQFDSSDSTVNRFIQQLIKSRATVDAPDKSGSTPLHQAAYRHNIAVAETLLQNGANIMARNLKGRTPLHESCLNILWYPEDGWTNQRPNIMSVLLKHGADINAQDSEGRTPLHLLVCPDPESRANTDMAAKWIPLLLNAKADANARDNNGKTPLHRVFQSQWPWRGAGEAIHLLLAAKSNVNARDNNGRTPLHDLASLSKNPSVFMRGVLDEMIAAGADLNAADNDGKRPLHYAAESGDPRLFSELISKGADPALPDNAGVTPLSLAQRNPRSMMMLPRERLATLDIFQAILASNTAAIENLLKTDPGLARITNSMGQTPLQVACLRNATNITQLLIARGAPIDPSAAAALGRTEILSEAIRNDPSIVNRMTGRKNLLMWAAEAGQTSSVQLLLEHDADVLLTDTLGQTAFFLAASKGHIATAELLRRHGAEQDIYAAAALGDVKWVASLIEHDTNLVNRPSNFQWTPLHSAARSGKADMVAMLVEKGSIIDAKDGLMQWTPLHCAALEGHVEAARILLEHHANPNARARRGTTPLLHALMKFHPEVARLLVLRGADVNAIDDRRETPLMRARFPLALPTPGEDPAERNRKRDELVQFLIEHGAKDRVNGSPFGPRSPMPGGFPTPSQPVDRPTELPRP